MESNIQGVNIPTIPFAIDLKQCPGLIVRQLQGRKRSGKDQVREINGKEYKVRPGYHISALPNGKQVATHRIDRNRWQPLYREAYNQEEMFESVGQVETFREVCCTRCFYCNMEELFRFHKEKNAADVMLMHKMQRKGAVCCSPFEMRLLLVDGHKEAQSVLAGDNVDPDTGAVFIGQSMERFGNDPLRAWFYKCCLCSKHFLIQRPILSVPTNEINIQDNVTPTEEVMDRNVPEGEVVESSNDYPPIVRAIQLEDETDIVANGYFLETKTAPEQDVEIKNLDLETIYIFRTNKSCCDGPDNCWRGNFTTSEWVFQILDPQSKRIVSFVQARFHRTYGYYPVYFIEYKENMTLEERLLILQAVIHWDTLNFTNQTFV